MFNHKLWDWSEICRQEFYSEGWKRSLLDSETLKSYCEHFELGDKDQQVSKSRFIWFLELDQFTPLFTTNCCKLRRSQKQYIRRKQVICWPGNKSEDGFATNNKITTNPYCTISPCKLGRKSAHIYYNILYPHNPYLVKSPKDPKNQLNDTCFASMDNFPLKRSCNWQADFISRQNMTIYHLFIFLKILHLITIWFYIFFWLAQVDEFHTFVHPSLHQKMKSTHIWPGRLST